MQKLCYFLEKLPLDKLLKNSPKWGPELVFPANQDPADILGRTDFHSEISLFECFILFCIFGSFVIIYYLFSLFILTVQHNF